jgi:hypothetical protein
MSDELTMADRIYSYATLRGYMDTQIYKKNCELEQKNKGPLLFSFIDPVPEHSMYNSEPGVLLNGCRLIPRKKISKKIVDLPTSLYGIHYIPESGWHQDIDREFNCFINRNDPIRQTWFYLLYDKKWLDQGYVSYNAFARPGQIDLDQFEYFDQIHHDYLSSFDHVYAEIRKIIPYKSFDETGDLRNTILRTKFSVVIETYFERTDSITFSEKTYRVLQTPRPWLLFHSTGSIQYLRDLGFYVYDDFIDHSYDLYDTKDNCVERQEAIFQRMEDLKKLKVSKSMIDYWESKTQDNLKIMESWFDNWKSDFEKVLNDAYITALDL